jgi:hypothetical protein
LAWYFQELKQLIKVLGSMTPAAFHMRMSFLITKDCCCHSIDLRARLQMVEKLLYEINQQEEAEIMTSSSTILLLLLLLLLLVFVLLVFSKLQGRQLLNP